MFLLLSLNKLTRPGASRFSRCMRMLKLKFIDLCRVKLISKLQMAMTTGRISKSFRFGISRTLVLFIYFQIEQLEQKELKRENMVISLPRLTLSWRRPLYISMDCFLYGNGLRHEKVKWQGVFLKNFIT